MNKSVFLGAALAAGALMMVPGVAVAFGRAAKPLVRAGLRTGNVAYDEFRKAGAEAFEHVEDILAEVREEMQAEREAEEDEGDVGAAKEDA